MNDALARRIEESGLNNLHTRRQMLYDGWMLFLLPGRAKRARSVTAHFGSSLPLADKIARCERIYARHGLPMLFRVTPFVNPASLDAELAARGYVAFDRSLVQDAALETAPVVDAGGECELETPALAAFVDAVGTMRCSSLTQRDAHLERLAQSPLDLAPVVARRDGAPVAAGLVSIDAEIAGVFDVVTLPTWRGQGIGTRVVAALLAQAHARGARRAYLQVTADNAPALALYRRFGFATVYEYHYRARPHECL